MIQLRLQLVDLKFHQIIFFDDAFSTIWQALELTEIGIALLINGVFSLNLLSDEFILFDRIRFLNLSDIRLDSLNTLLALLNRDFRRRPSIFTHVNLASLLGSFKFHVFYSELFGIQFLFVQLTLIVISVFLGIFELDLHLVHDDLLVFGDFVELECFGPEPVSLLFNRHNPIFLLRLNFLCICFLFQLLHILKDNIHFILECSKEIILIVLYL